MTENEIEFWLATFLKNFGDEAFDRLIHENNCKVIAKYSKRSKGGKAKIQIKEFYESAAKAAKKIIITSIHEEEKDEHKSHH